MDLQTFNYNGTGITFDFNRGGKMVNATEMAKAFGKQPAHFLKTAPTQDFICALQNRYNSGYSGIVRVINGGASPGTWMHEKLALKFAAWLSPNFELWVFDRIEELLTTGSTTINREPTRLELLQMAMAAEQERLALAAQNEQQAAQIAELQPKADYTDRVLTSTTTYTATQLAKDLGFTSARALNKWLQHERIQYKQNGQWLLYAAYAAKGYTKTATFAFDRSDGATGTALQTRWTEAGREMLVRRIEQN